MIPNSKMGDLNKVSLTYKNKNLELMYQEDQWPKVQKIYKRVIIASLILSLINSLHCGISYFEEEEKEKQIMGIKLLFCFCIICLSELFICHFQKLRSLHGTLLILALYVVQIEYSIIFRNSFFTSPIAITGVFGSLYIGIHVTASWYHAFSSHLIGLFYYAAKCLLDQDNLRTSHNEIMNLSVSKFVIMIISSLYVGGIIFREEEIQKRTSYCAQILNLSKRKQLKHILTKMPMGIMLMKNGIDFANHALLEILAIHPSQGGAKNTFTNKIKRMLEEIKTEKGKQIVSLSEIIQSESDNIKYIQENNYGSFLEGTRSEIFSFKERLSKKRTKTKWIEVMITPFDFNENRTILVVIKDQTPFRKLEEETIRNNLNNLLMTSMSHELRTPLHIMMTMLQLIQIQTKEKFILSYSKKAEISGQLLIYLINGLLDYYQIQNKSFKIKYETVDVKEIIRKAADLIKENIRPEVKLEIEPHPDLPQMLTFDATRFPLILTNLLANAAKYTFKGSIKVFIKFNITTKALLCSVKDTGIGISSHLKNRIFKFFHNSLDNQSENSNRIEHGIGMGLGIVKALSVALKGNVEFKSNEGIGSIFTFYIRASYHKNSVANLLNSASISHPEIFRKENIKRMPISSHFYCTLNPNEGDPDVSAESNRIIEKETELAPATLIPMFYTKQQVKGFGKLSTKSNNNASVLTVDDQAVNLFAVKALLKTCGLQVDEASNGEEGIKKVLEAENRICGNYKLIIMDCNMPIMDGYQATIILREKMAERKIAQVPIVALTAYVSDLSIQECFHCGMELVLYKPLTLDALKEVLFKYKLI